MLQKKLLNILTEQINDLLTFEQFLQLFKSGLIIEEESIRHKINISNDLIKYIDINLKQQLITKIDKETINSFYENKFKHLEDVYVVNINFNDIKQFQQFALQLTHLQKLSIQQKYALNFIKIKLQNTNGFFTNFNKILNANLMIFNKNTYTYQTIRHECIHYFQTYEKYGLVKNIKIPRLNQKRFDYFPQKVNHEIIIKSLFNKKEFSTTLDNLISYLNIIYDKYFSKIFIRDFIINFINNISNKTIFNSDIYKFWKRQNFSLKELYFILYAKEINKHLYDKIIICLTNIKSD